MGKTTVLEADVDTSVDRELDYFRYWDRVAAQEELDTAHFVQVPPALIGHKDLRRFRERSHALCRCESRRLLVAAESREFRGREPQELGTKFIYLAPTDGDARSAFAGVVVQDGTLMIRRTFTPDGKLPYQALIDLTQHRELSSTDTRVLFRSNMQRYPFVLGAMMAGVVVPVCAISRDRRTQRFTVSIDVGVDQLMPTPAEAKPFNRPHRCSQ
ncbi:MAG TPA: hypothetical protein VLG40_05145 [Candidatus Saccharimonas sp.]|nr:hypothetical protein [Candidatus Saccharimonas sp.]